MKPRAEIKRLAKDNFIKSYWPCVAAGLLVGLVVGTLNTLSGGIATLILGPSFFIGYNMFSLSVYKGEPKDPGSIFSEAFENFGHKLGGYLWMELFIFLWSLLFFVPGIIKSLSYAMTPYLLDDCKNLPAKDALKVSMRMMKGHKWELFVFHLSFIGWHLLSVLTLGILTIFLVSPYQNTALAGYYEERKKSALEEGIITEAELNGEPVAA